MRSAAVRSPSMTSVVLLALAARAADAQSVPPIVFPQDVPNCRPLLQNENYQTSLPPSLPPEEIVYNNLGGSVQGLPPYLQFSGIGQYQGRALQLRIAEERNATLQLRNTRLRSTYAMSDGGSNGLMVDDLGFSQMGRINLAAPRTPINEPTHREGSWPQRHWPQGHDPGHSFVDLTMCILDENERKVVLPAFEFTFVDATQLKFSNALIKYY